MLALCNEGPQTREAVNKKYRYTPAQMSTSTAIYYYYYLFILKDIQCVINILAIAIPS